MMRLALAGLLAVALAGLGGAVASPQPGRANAADALTQMNVLAKSVGGTVGVAAIHVETGRTIEIQGRRPLPL
jgi:beta-lactamase class A